MKFGICSEIFKDWNDIGRTIDYVKAAGYDGLEVAPFTLAPRVTQIPAHTRQDIVQKAAAADLDILGIHWVFVGPDGVHLTHPDEAVRKHTAAYLVDLVNFCGDLGGKIIVFGSPKQRNVEEGVSYDQAFGYARAAFEHALPACEARGVTICMEPLTHLETNFCKSVAETVRLIEAVKHPNFQLILDTKAMAFEEEGRPALIRKYASYMKHYHANDENLHGPGFGDVDFAPIFAALKEVDFGGYVSVEVFNFEPGPEAIATKSLAHMKRFI
ncbi:MAG: sugar phosphate isomerase/epimerase [Candidatus Hydrogenedentes bacterium]|nr:sugar phosphate isomerase/epimerase [Candidatus Hydrogenedentota bacterium]